MLMTEVILIEKLTHGTFGRQVQFFTDRRTLKVKGDLM